MEKHSINIEEPEPAGSYRSDYFIGNGTHSKKAAFDRCMAWIKE